MNNDLISREALKKKLREEVLNVPMPDYNRDYAIGTKQGLNLAIALLDNAPTVSDRYDEGYAQGYIDGSTGADMKGGAENE